VERVPERDEDRRPSHGGSARAPLGFDTAGTSGFAGNFNYLRLTPTTVSMTTTLTNSHLRLRPRRQFAGSNFGSDSTLVAKKHSTLDGSREIYLSFDLSSVSTIASGKLRLYGSLNDTSSASVQTRSSAAPRRRGRRTR
jgi:hypothetical protein